MLLPAIMQITLAGWLLSKKCRMHPSPVADRCRSTSIALVTVRVEAAQPRMLRMPRICSTMAIIAAFLLFAFSASANASEYPDHGIKLTVAWPAGGSTDLVGRFVAEQLSVALKQPVVVENRAGANGNI